MRYAGRFPKVAAAPLDTGQEFVIPVSHPFNKTTGGRVAFEGTVNAAADPAK
jgi:hypothetical protein